MGCGGFTCSKNALAALNVLYILVAFILIGVASYGRAIAIITSISILSGIIVCGVFLLFIAFIGLIGAVKHHQVLLFFYMIILFLIFLVQFVVACTLLAVNTTQQKNLAIAGWEKSDDSMKSTVQKTGQCCGLMKQYQGISDDKMSHPICGLNTEHEHIEQSNLECCKVRPNAPCCAGTNSTTNSTETGEDCPCEGCWDKYGPYMENACKATGGIGLFFSFTEIFGVWITVKYRNQKDPRANPSAFL